MVPRGHGIYLIRATPADMKSWLKKIRGSIFWDEQVDPTVEAGVINYDMTLNQVSAAWRRYPQIDGAGQTVSVKEGRPDTNDIDLAGKLRSTSFISDLQDNHATIMSTMIVGAANSSFRGKGVAYRGWYSSSDFELVLPDSVSYYRDGQIHIQNHSYGTGVQNYYGVNARAFDQSALDDTTLLHIISAGNAGTSASNSGTYAGLRGFANITGNFKQSKNGLLAGAQLSDGTVPVFSSKGPLYDGRIAPHLVAIGDDGTSGAAALISGTSLLIHQLFRQQYGRVPGNTLVKALLINTARDIGGEGPGYSSGYGSLDASAALRAVVDGTFYQGVLQKGGFVEKELSVGSDVQTLKVTLVWNDPAAEPGTSRSLINDLDLEVEEVQSGSVFFPWILPVAPSADSLLSFARRGIDRLNNTEQVSIRLPAVGQYKIRVKYRDGVSAVQPFSIVYQVDPTKLFQWDFPLPGDQWISGEEQWLRWSSDDTQNKGILEVSTDEGKSWIEQAGQIDIQHKQFRLFLPDTMRLIRFRMRTGQQVFETGDNIVAPSRALKLGLVCDTSALLYWSRIDGAQQYVVYRFENNQMVRAGITADTSILLNARKGSVFALAGKTKDMEGIRGVAVDYRNQKVGCYINRFFVGPGFQNGAALLLDLGTIYNVAGIEIIKRSDKNRVIFSQKPLTGLSYSAEDLQLHQGRNVYQAIVTRSDGSKVYSDEQALYYLGGKKHLLFPNPASKGQPIYLLSDLTDDVKAEILDLNGRLIQQFTLTENIQLLPSANLPSGMYALRIHEPDGSLQRITFIIR